MLFNSFEFPFFFAVVFIFYYSLPHRHRWILLLTASYYFYACWQLEYIFLLATSTLIDYLCALGIQKTADKQTKLTLLLFSLTSNLSLLFAFKYANFFSEGIRQVFAPFNLFQSIPELSWVMPIGISFYTLQTIGYSIDVYRGKRKAERHLGLFALYVSFFPQLVAGPIERSTRLLPQFHKHIHFDIDKIRMGFLLLLWGFFKKLVIADQLSISVGRVYNVPQDYSAPVLALATYAAAFRIYCDFSGYTDIARGSAMMLGIDLMENFKRPFAASNLRSFWQRWHISLTQWVFDYLYYPLLKNYRKIAVIKALGMLLVFIIIGFWHGANWTFILFGLYYGILFILSDTTSSLVKKYNKTKVAQAFKLFWDNKTIGITLNFHIFLISGVLFTATSLSDALFIYQKVLTGDWSGGSLQQAVGDMFEYPVKIAVVGIIIMELVQWSHEKSNIWQNIINRPLIIRWSIYYSLIFSILMFGNLSWVQFQYFQF